MFLHLCGTDLSNIIQILFIVRLHTFKRLGLQRSKQDCTRNRHKIKNIYLMNPLSVFTTYSFQRNWSYDDEDDTASNIHQLVLYHKIKTFKK